MSTFSAKPANASALVSMLSDSDSRALISWLRTQDLVPSLKYLYGVAERPEYHPEKDVGVHLEMAVSQSWRFCNSPEERCAVLLHDIGKSVTGRAIANPTNVALSPIKLDEQGAAIPSHYRHERIGALMMADVFTQLDLPNEWLHLATVVADFHLRLHTILDCPPAGVISFIEDILQSPPCLGQREIIESFIRCVRSDHNGRLGYKNAEYPQGSRLLDAYDLILEFEQASSERELANSKIEERKMAIFASFKALNPDSASQAVWKDTMAELSRQQLAGDAPPRQQTLNSYVAEGLATSVGQKPAPSRFRP